MRKTILLLAAMAMALMLASGVALAVTKQCGRSCEGTLGDDLLLGDDRPNAMQGRGGNDTLKGFGEDDFLGGGAGRDIVYGFAGPDTLFGGSGDDRLFGGEGPFEDQLRGGPGNDRHNGGAGDDSYGFLLIGCCPPGERERDLITDASGEDTLGIESEDGLIIDLTPAGQPNARTRPGTWTADWEGSVVESAFGSRGNDKMIGNDAPNMLYGMEGKNNISGGGGDDNIDTSQGTLSGGPGDDLLSGGGTFFGGPGDDTIRGGTLVDCGEGVDIVTLSTTAPEPVNCETVNRF